MIGVEATQQALSCTSGVKAKEEDALKAVFRAFVTANTEVVALQVKPRLVKNGFWRTLRDT